MRHAHTHKYTHTRMHTNHTTHTHKRNALTHSDTHIHNRCCGRGEQATTTQRTAISKLRATRPTNSTQLDERTICWSRKAVLSVAHCCRNKYYSYILLLDFFEVWHYDKCKTMRTILCGVVKHNTHTQLFRYFCQYSHLPRIHCTVLWL